MLETGTCIRIQLPGKKKFQIGNVVHCSTKGRSCKLAFGDDDIRTVDLHKCEYEVLSMSEDEGSESSLQPSSPSEATTEAGFDSFAKLSAPSAGIDKLTDILLNEEEAENLLQPSEDMSKLTKQALKELVDYSLMDLFVPKTAEASKYGFYVDGFDPEQIWLQFDTISTSALKHVKRALHKTAHISSIIPEDVEEALDDLLKNRMGDDISDDDVAESSDAREDEYGGEDQCDQDSEEDAVQQNMSTVEDEYLNLDDMEAFLQEAEEAHARESEGDSSDEEEALDNVLDDAMGKKKSIPDDQIDLSEDPLANAKHDDFFAPVTKKKTGKKVRFEDADDSHSEHSLGLDESESEEEDEFEDDQFGMDQESDDQELSQDDDDDNDEDQEEEGEGEEEEEEGLPSKHQMKLDRISSKIRKMEEEALEEKEWYMRGEISGFHRPKNSALEVDMDFETTMKPPPQPTEETTQSLEEMIKQRIADHRFDDVIAITPSNEEKKKTIVELDDVKSSQGLGEIYENEYLAARTQGMGEDKEEPIRELAKKQFVALCAKLDQLSHGQYKPMPSIEEVTFKVDVPAIMMEEATPAFVSDASMRKPEEVYKPGQSLQKSITVEDEEGDEKVITTREGMMQADGVTKSEAELTREDRKRRRAARKRAYKKHKSSKDADQIQRALAAGKTPIPGRKSEAANQMLQKLAQTAKKSSDKNFSKSREVFARMNDIAAGIKPVKDTEPRKKAMHLKL